MAAEAARADRVDRVDSPDGTGDGCRYPTTQYTDEGSPNVFIGDHPAVRLGDKMSEHNGPGCNPHAPALSVASTTVFINGKGAGRKGDFYGGTHEIVTGSSTVFIGG